MKGLLLALIIGLGVAMKFDFIANPFFQKPAFVEGYADSVVLYATTWCGYCARTRELFSEQEIAYTEYDIEASAQGRDEYDQLGGGGVPLLIIGGEIVRGYDPDRILELAAALPQSAELTGITDIDQTVWD